MIKLIRSIGKYIIAFVCVILGLIKLIKRKPYEK